MKLISRSARFIQCPPSTGWCVARPLNDARHGFAIAGTFATLALARAALCAKLCAARRAREEVRRSSYYINFLSQGRTLAN